MTLDGLICTYARTTTSVQVYLRWPPARSVRSRAASTRRRRPLRHENDCWLRLLAHVWMGFASFFVSALTRSWATGLKFYGLQRYSLKISFGQGGAGAQFRRQSGPPVRRRTAAWGSRGWRATGSASGRLAEVPLPWNGHEAE